jgi:hypothetical protein
VIVVRLFCETSSSESTVWKSVARETYIEHETSDLTAVLPEFSRCGCP